MRRMFKRCLACNWLRVPVIELALRVDMKPSDTLIVLVAMDVARFAPPFESSGFIGKRSLDRREMPEVDLDRRRHLIGYMVMSVMLEMSSLFFEGLFFCIINPHRSLRIRPMRFCKSGLPTCKQSIPKPTNHRPLRAPKTGHSLAGSQRHKQKRGIWRYNFTSQPVGEPAIPEKLGREARCD